MSTNIRTVAATVDQVWEVLCDGWLYPLWVVGASRMREVDDTTEVLEVEDHRRLLLRARGWPMGAAHVDLTLYPRGRETEIVIQEQAVSGPGAVMPKVLQDPPLTWRNVETLRRLAFVVERRP